MLTEQRSDNRKLACFRHDSNTRLYFRDSVYSFNLNYGSSNCIGSFVRRLVTETIHLCLSFESLTASTQPRQCPCDCGFLLHSLHGSDASISLFQFRYDIDTIFTKYRDVDIDIDIKYVSKMHAFCRLKF